MHVALIDREEALGRWDALAASFAAPASFRRAAPDALEPLLAGGRVDALLLAVGNGIDAPGLMQRLRELSPETLRVLVVPEDMAASGATALGARCGAQQLLVEPLSEAEVRRVLRRLLTVRSLLTDKVLRARLGALERLPAAPNTYLALQQATSDPLVDMMDVVALVQRDAGLATRVLRVANSALLARGRPVTDLAMAVQRLGMGTLSQLVLGAEVFGSAGPEAERLQQTGLLASRLAMRITPAMAPRTAVGQAASAALLADVGKLLPAGLLAEAELSAQWRRLPTASLLGACLLALWGLPMELVEAVAYRHAPALVEPDRPGLAGVVHVCSALAADESPDIGYLDALGLAGQLPQWQAWADDMKQSS